MAPEARADSLSKSSSSFLDVCFVSAVVSRLPQSPSSSSFPSSQPSPEAEAAGAAMELLALSEEDYVQYIKKEFKTHPE